MRIFSGGSLHKAERW